MNVRLNGAEEAQGEPLPHLTAAGRSCNGSGERCLYGDAAKWEYPADQDAGLDSAEEQPHEGRFYRGGGAAYACDSHGPSVFIISVHARA